MAHFHHQTLSCKSYSCITVRADGKDCSSLTADFGHNGIFLKYETSAVCMMKCHQLSLKNVVAKEILQGAFNPAMLPVLVQAVQKL